MAGFRSCFFISKNIVINNNIYISDRAGAKALDWRGIFAPHHKWRGLRACLHVSAALASYCFSENFIYSGKMYSLTEPYIVSGYFKLKTYLDFVQDIFLLITIIDISIL